MWLYFKEETIPRPLLKERLLIMEMCYYRNNLRDQPLAKQDLIRRLTKDLDQMCYKFGMLKFAKAAQDGKSLDQFTRVRDPRPRA